MSDSVPPTPAGLTQDCNTESITEFFNNDPNDFLPQGPYPVCAGEIGLIIPIDQTEATLIAYPNPSRTGLVNVLCGKDLAPGATVRVYSDQGRLLLTQRYSEEGTSLNLGNYRGLAYLRVVNHVSTKVATAKIVLQ